MSHAVASRTFTFCAAHRLHFHGGDCQNLHGHTYSVTISFGGQYVGDMVLDLMEMKLICEDIHRDLDHSVLVHEDDKELLELVKNLSTSKGPQRYFLVEKWMGSSTSLETLCYLIKTRFYRILSLSAKKNKIYFNRISVRVSESPSAYVERTWDIIEREWNEDEQSHDNP